MTQQNEALRLADELDGEFVQGRISNHTGRKAATELRRLSAVEADFHMAYRMKCDAQTKVLHAQRDALLEFARYVEAIDPGNPAPLFEKARDAIKAVEGEK
jgi:hypothetical protein